MTIIRRLQKRLALFYLSRLFPEAYGSQPLDMATWRRSSVKPDLPCGRQRCAMGAMSDPFLNIASMVEPTS